LRVVCYGAGGPAGFNFCKAAQAAGWYVFGVDSSELHRPFVDACSDETVIGPLDEASSYLDADVFHSQPEQGVRLLSTRRDYLNVLLPNDDVLTVCRDKATSAIHWAGYGLRRFPPARITDPYPDALHHAADKLGQPFWLRATEGAGARGATLVDDLRTGYHWLRYWESRGFEGEWIAEEYLPGREYNWSGVFRDGELYAGFARERLEWLYPHLAPSGRTGTPTVAVTVDAPLVVDTALAAIDAIDPKPNGVYCVDLVQDFEGIPRPTEINAGRFATTTPLYHEVGPNLVDIYLRLAMGEDVEPLGPDCMEPGITLARHIDCGTHVLAPVRA
jgi:hypothetical protein